MWLGSGRALLTLIVRNPNSNMRAAPKYCPIGRLLFKTSGRLLKALPMLTLMTVIMASAPVEPIRLRHLPTYKAAQMMGPSQLNSELCCEH